MSIISSTVWDGGSTTWDSGSTLWDPHRQIDGTVVTLTLSELDATVVRPPISVSLATLTLSELASSIIRPPITASLAVINLTENAASIIRPDIDVVNTPGLALSEFSANVERTINVQTDALVLTGFNTDVDHPQIVTLANVPAIAVSKFDSGITITSRNLTFFIGPVF